jgi:Ferredoxin-like domain in Api92-like protein
MANWCECELTVCGPTSDLQRFLAGLHVPDEIKILQAYVPIPEPLRAVSRGSGSLGYEILYTDAWIQIACYPWIQERCGGRPAGTREDVWNAYVDQRAGFGETEATLMAVADRYRQNLDDYGSLDWYAWACTEWGTKWGDCKTRIVHVGPRRVDFAFECAWTPPTRGLHKIAGLFPSLTFTLNYWERGIGIQGHTIWQRGELAAATQTDYSGPRGG